MARMSFSEMMRYSLPSILTSLARVLRVDDAIADLDVHRQLRAVVEHAAGADGEDDAFLGLFFGRVGQENAAGALFGLLDVLDDHAIAQVA